MATMLPTELIDDKEYFRDDRLREYRNVDNPHDMISFEEKDVFDGGRRVGVDAGKVALELGETDADDFMQGWQDNYERVSGKAHELQSWDESEP